MDPENPPDAHDSPPGSNTDVDHRQSSKVPRWVIKAIALFWIGWAITYIGTGMVRNLRALLVVMLISLFLSFAIEPAVNRLEGLSLIHI